MKLQLPKWFQYSIVAGLIGIGYFAVTEDSQIAVDANGTPTQLSAKIRSVINPSKFYSRQKALIEMEIAKLRTAQLPEDDFNKQIEALNQQQQSVELLARK